jgi:hypothetical protein
MNLSDSPDTDPVFDAYLSALSESFHDEPWEAIEQYARRIWTECRMDGDADWGTVRERARDAWPDSIAPVPRK